jgi:hypothetical protein
MKNGKVTVFATLLLFGAMGCADLDVTNPNAPDRDRALTEAGDVESLLGGAFSNWHLAMNDIDGPGPLLSTIAFQHSAFPANFSMVFYSGFPRREFVNDQARGEYFEVANAWIWNYRAISSVNDAIQAIDAGEFQLPADRERRARAFGAFVRGLAHGSVALMFDQGPIVDESVGFDEAGLPDVSLDDFVSYEELMEAAMGFFDEAIAQAEAGPFPDIPSAWAQNDITRDQLIGYAHAMKAQFRAANARTPEERGAVDWQAVLDDLGQAQPWTIEYGPTEDRYHFNWLYMNFLGWSQETYFIMGMADQSGNVQQWFERDVLEREPVIDGQEVLVVTPDTRFPQGATIEEQEANPGTQIRLPPGANAVAGWARPDRGTWRWSYYKWIQADPALEFGDAYTSHLNRYAGVGTIDVLPESELRMLEAEANFWLGNLGATASLVNESRTAAGLNATDAGGTNASCVPRIPVGDWPCADDLYELMKWEWRMENRMYFPYSAPWYFHGRGWGDLPEGTPLHFPVPAREYELEGGERYTFGGIGGPGASAGSTYGY